MSYTVLARKYRSRTFDEIAGQEAIATTLKNAISSDRVHHGYLFSGTRGVGKTSTARILAKALNCQSSDGPVTEPCGECDSCTAITEGGDMDVIEIDAASNTGVDNIRELRNNASYRPARSRFKIYIIDEVHMLSTGAFNALLKTLEEPPGHVKFIMATTEPQKVPATILSRVQRFEFRSIGADTVADRLRYILKEEGITAEDEVVRRVARLANGSMRDALSVLDQLLSLGNDSLTGALIDSVLPASYDEILSGLIDRVAENDPAGTLGALDEYVSRGNTLERFCDGLIDHFRTLMLLNVCGADTDLVDVPVAVREAAVAQSKQFDGPTYVYFITLLEELRRNVRFSGSGRALADAAMVKLAEAQQFSSLSALLSGSGAAVTGQKKKHEPVAGTNSGQTGKTTPSPATPVREPETEQPVREVGPSPAEREEQIAAAASASKPIEIRPTIRPAAEPPGVSSGKPAASELVGKLAAGLSQEERRKALADKLVREAMDLFDGTVVNVERQGAAELPEDPTE